MTFKQVRGALSAPLEWIADQIKARPKTFLVSWAISTVIGFALGAWVR